MLGKLIKHEWKATWKYLFLANGGLLLLSLLGRLGVAWITGNNAEAEPWVSSLAGIYLSAYVFSIIGVFFVTHIVLIVRYYKNFYTDEGYLMHTLPVTPAAKLFSKFLVNFIWSILNIISIILSVFILFFKDVELEDFMEGFREGLDIAGEFLNAPSWQIITFFLILGVAALIQSIMKYYFCISAGACFRHKIIGAILTYGILYMFSQMISVIFLVFTVQANDAPNASAFWLLMTLELIISLIMIAFYSTVTHYLLKRKLNMN